LAASESAPLAAIKPANTGPDNKTYNAPETFERKTDAARWLSVREAEITRGDWINPDAGEIEFGTYTGEWMKDRVLKTRTRELYDGLLRNHLLPTWKPPLTMS
jgi:hypothetical protein